MGELSVDISRYVGEGLNRPFMRLIAQELRGSVRPAPMHRNGVGVLIEDHEFSKVMGAGHSMERSVDLLRAVADEMTEAKRVLESLANEVMAIYGVVAPMLVTQIQEIRQARMTAATEINLALASMREIRKFFLESTYTVEMERLERFVKLCRELQALKAEGVLDATADLAIRLAVKEEGKG